MNTNKDVNLQSPFAKVSARNLISEILRNVVQFVKRVKLLNCN